MDAFCHVFAPLSYRRLLPLGQRQRTRQTALALSEMLPLLVSLPWRHSRPCKHAYTEDVAVPLRPYCPQLVRSQRVVELLPRALVPLGGYRATRQGRGPGLACLDSTPLAVCANHRMAPHKVFEGLARRGKPARGWFSGFNVPLLGNDEGARLALRLTPGHGDDRQPVERLATGLEGQLFGARGSLAQALHDLRLGPGLALLTKSRQHRKTRWLRLWDTLLWRKRSLIETIHAQLKNIRHIEPPRHRRVTGFMVKLIAGVVAYSFRPKKPSLGLKRDPLLPMLVV